MPTPEPTNGGHFKWTVERLIGLLAAGGGIVAILAFFGIKEWPRDATQSATAPPAITVPQEPTTFSPFAWLEWKDGKSKANFDRYQNRLIPKLRSLGFRVQAVKNGKNSGETPKVFYNAADKKRAEEISQAMSALGYPTPTPSLDPNRPINQLYIYTAD